MEREVRGKGQGARERGSKEKGREGSGVFMGGHWAMPSKIFWCLSVSKGAKQGIIVV